MGRTCFEERSGSWPQLELLAEQCDFPGPPKCMAGVHTLSGRLPRGSPDSAAPWAWPAPRLHIHQGSVWGHHRTRCGHCCQGRPPLPRACGAGGPRGCSRCGSSGLSCSGQPCPSNFCNTTNFLKMYSTISMSKIFGSPQSPHVSLLLSCFWAHLCTKYVHVWRTSVYNARLYTKFICVSYIHKVLPCKKNICVRGSLCSMYICVQCIQNMDKTFTFFMKVRELLALVGRRVTSTGDDSQFSIKASQLWLLNGRWCSPTLSICILLLQYFLSIKSWKWNFWVQR